MGLARFGTLTVNVGEHPRNRQELSRLLKKLYNRENTNDIKGLRTASQAYDEDQIPFARFDVSTELVSQLALFSVPVGG
jgi:hypothetical protein